MSTGTEQPKLEETWLCNLRLKSKFVFGQPFLLVINWILGCIWKFTTCKRKPRVKNKQEEKPNRGGWESLRQELTLGPLVPNDPPNGHFVLNSANELILTRFIAIHLCHRVRLYRIKKINMRKLQYEGKVWGYSLTKSLKILQISIFSFYTKLSVIKVLRGGSMKKAKEPKTRIKRTNTSVDLQGSA